MAIVSTPLGNKIENNLSLENIIQMLRHAVISEFDAFATYDSIIKAPGCPEIIKKPLTDVMHEEMVHAGQINRLLQYLEPIYDQKFKAGEIELNVGLVPKTKMVPITS